MKLEFIDACTEEHFAAMSLIHALGWRTTYHNALPARYLAEEITDERWIPHFREDHAEKRCHGLLLYSDGIPVACGNYGRARSTDPAYHGWGEVVSFYTHPNHRGRGYGGALMEEILRRLRADGYPAAYLLVLRENEGARRFYARHGFSHDGTQEDILFPENTICVDLRYICKL